jgi:hypothetical protein
MSYLSKHFREISGSPKPVQFRSLFAGRRAGSSYAPGSNNTSELLQQLVSQVRSLNNVVSGKSGSSALGNVLGGSVLGGIAQGGFSWQSILKDVFPLGGLISGIAGLFESAPTAPPLDQYDAPPSLNFEAVLNANGSLSQGSSDQYGHTRASSAGLDLTDAQGGPVSPYQRAANGSLVPVGGDSTSRYSGSLNLPEMLQPLVQISPAAQSSSVTNPVGSSSVSAEGSAAASASGQTADQKSELPAFDQQWFNDHGSQIASAVRTQLLNYHPIVDAINDL